MSIPNKTDEPRIKGQLLRYPEGGSDITQDFDDAYSDLIVLERTDMVIDSTTDIAYRCPTTKGETLWLNKRIGYNAAGEAVYILRLSHGDTAPAFATAIVASLA